MTGPMDHEPLSPEIREAAEAYHRPPETPREEMWTAIQQSSGAEARKRRSALRLLGSSAHRWLAPAAIAAALALAFGLGRLSSRPETRWDAGAPVAAATPGPGPGTAGSVAFRIAAVEHLGQAESFLTLFRTSVRSGRSDGLASPAARQLLATNRLLLDSPASADPRLRLLLEDLELVLAGIAQIAPGRASEEAGLITEDLERSAVLLRLRAAVPAGSAAPARPGAL
ncbi:MAG: hypothetical protein ACREOF_20975 [Gemmatimonadales bacterium]